MNNCGSSPFDDEGYCTGDYGYSVSLSYAKDQLGAGMVRENVLGLVSTMPNPYDVRDEDIVESGGVALFSWLLQWDTDLVSHRMYQICSTTLTYHTLWLSHYSL